MWLSSGLSDGGVTPAPGPPPPCQLFPSLSCLSAPSSQTGMNTPALANTTCPCLENKVASLEECWDKRAKLVIVRLTESQQLASSACIHTRTMHGRELWLLKSSQYVLCFLAISKQKLRPISTEDQALMATACSPHDL